METNTIETIVHTMDNTDSSGWPLAFTLVGIAFAAAWFFRSIFGS